MAIKGNGSSSKVSLLRPVTVSVPTPQISGGSDRVLNAALKVSYLQLKQHPGLVGHMDMTLRESGLMCGARCGQDSDAHCMLLGYSWLLPSP